MTEKYDVILNLLENLEEAKEELKHEKVSWVDKHFIIDLNQKTNVLIESIKRFEDEEQETVIESAQEFLIEVNPIIQKINEENTGA